MWCSMRQSHAVHVRTACAGGAPCSLLFFSSTKPKSFVSSSVQRIIPLGVTSWLRSPKTVVWSLGTRNVGQGWARVVARCVSSVLTAQQEPTAVDWNEAVSSSEVGNGGGGGTLEEDPRRSLPVRAYFFSTRSDIAWKDAKYGQIWEYLRDEFELTQRFASLDFKLKFVKHNIRFLQEILQNRKSDFLEWCVIVLISAEIAISLFDLIKKSL